MMIFIKAKLNKPDRQTNINKNRVAALKIFQISEQDSEFLGLLIIIISKFIVTVQSYFKKFVSKH